MHDTYDTKNNGEYAVLDEAAYYLEEILHAELFEDDDSSDAQAHHAERITESRLVHWSLLQVLLLVIVLAAIAALIVFVVFPQIELLFNPASPSQLLPAVRA